MEKDTGFSLKRDRSYPENINWPYTSFNPVSCQHRMVSVQIWISGLTVFSTSSVAPADAGDFVGILKSGDKGCGCFISQDAEVERLAVKTDDATSCVSEAYRSLGSGHLQVKGLRCCDGANNLVVKLWSHQPDAEVIGSKLHPLRVFEIGLQPNSLLVDAVQSNVLPT